MISEGFMQVKEMQQGSLNQEEPGMMKEDTQQ